MFVSVYVAAFHAPKPHGLPVVAVGTPPSVRQLARGLNDELPGGFSVDPAPDPSFARVAIEHRRAYGAARHGASADHATRSPAPQFGQWCSPSVAGTVTVRPQAEQSSL